MKLPRGKYKDQDIEDVPSDYLAWVLTDWNLRPDQVREIENQLALRRGEGVVRKEGHDPL